MIFTYMCKTCGCSFRSREFGKIERFMEPCILLLLTKNSSHGYGLMEGLEKHCGEKMDAGDLYRTLRRMERDSWVTSEWDKKEKERDKRVYSITKTGRVFLNDAITSLRRTDELIHHLFSGYKKLYPKEAVL